MNHPFRLPNLEHQETEFNEFRFSKARALLWQMRTGKSKACIDLACDLFERGEIDRVVILAPNNVHIGWIKRQIKIHMWERVKYRGGFWSSKLDKKKGWFDALDANILRPKQAFDGLLFYAMNSEAARYPKPKKTMEVFIAKAEKGVLFIADESQDFAKASSQRGRLARAMGKHCKYKRILTGSGFDNSPLKAWGQYEILEPEALGFKTFGAFEGEYAVKGIRKMGNRQFLAIEGFKNLENLRESIARWSSVVTRDDVKGLPPLNFSHEYFELSAEQESIYHKITNKVIMETPDTSGFQVSKVFEGGVNKLKLLQVTSGFFVNEYGETYWLETNPRAEVLRRILQEHIEQGKKLIVWCRFVNDIEAVTKVFKEENAKAVQFYGAIDALTRQRNIDEFMDNPDCVGFIGNPKAGGRGIDLSVARTIVWYSRDYDLEFKRQADERATHVGGESTDIIEIVAQGTVDVSIMEALEEKLTISEMIDRSGLQAFLNGQTQAFEDSVGL